MGWRDVTLGGSIVDALLIPTFCLSTPQATTADRRFQHIFSYTQKICWMGEKIFAYSSRTRDIWPLILAYTVLIQIIVKVKCEAQEHKLSLRWNIKGSTITKLNPQNCAISRVVQSGLRRILRYDPYWDQENGPGAWLVRIQSAELRLPYGLSPAKTQPAIRRWELCRELWWSEINLKTKKKNSINTLPLAVSRYNRENTSMIARTPSWPILKQLLSQ